MSAISPPGAKLSDVELDDIHNEAEEGQPPSVKGSSDGRVYSQVPVDDLEGANEVTRLVAGYHTRFNELGPREQWSRPSCCVQWNFGGDWGAMCAGMLITVFIGSLIGIGIVPGGQREERSAKKTIIGDRVLQMWSFLQDQIASNTSWAQSVANTTQTITRATFELFRDLHAENIVECLTESGLGPQRDRDFSEYTIDSDRDSNMLRYVGFIAANVALSMIPLVLWQMSERWLITKPTVIDARGHGDAKELRSLYQRALQENRAELTDAQKVEIRERIKSLSWLKTGPVWQSFKKWAIFISIWGGYYYCTYHMYKAALSAFHPVISYSSQGTPTICERPRSWGPAIMNNAVPNADPSLDVQYPQPAFQQFFRSK